MCARLLAHEVDAVRPRPQHEHVRGALGERGAVRDRFEEHRVRKGLLQPWSTCWRLQPCGLEAAAVCVGGCNPVRWRLQLCVLWATVVCVVG